MNAQIYFERLILINDRINADQEELQRIREMMNTIQSPTLGGQPNGKGGVNSRVENIVIKYADLESQIMDDIEKLVDHKRDAMRVITQIEDPAQRYVLQEYYICGRSLEYIAAQQYLTYRRISQIKYDALQSAQKIIDRK